MEKHFTFVRKDLRSLIILLLVIGFLPSISSDISALKAKTITADVPYDLDGKDIVVFISDEYNDEEMSAVRYKLEFWGATFTVAGLEDNMTSHQNSTWICPDILISEVNITDYDCLYFTGGYAAYHLVEHQEVLDIVRTANDEGLVIAAFCHGPLVLARAGIISGKTVTGFYYDIGAELILANATYFQDNVVTDGNLVTGNWPHFLEFSEAIAELLAPDPTGTTSTNSFSTSTDVAGAPGFTPVIAITALFLLVVITFFRKRGK